MTHPASATFFFHPSFDEADTVALLDAWYDLPSFEPTTPRSEHVEALEAGRPVHVRGRWGSVIVTITVGTPPPEHLPALPHLGVELGEQYFGPGSAPESDVPDHVGDYVDCVARFAERADDVGHAPCYVLGADPNQLSALYGEIEEPIETTREGILDGRLEQLYWLQVLPEPMVDAIGRDALHDAPAWRVDDLQSGAVLFVAYVNPHFPDFDAKPAIEDHVGVDLHTYWV